METHTQSQQLVVFTIGGEQYALPISGVQEIIRYSDPRSAASADPSVRGILSLRGRIVPVLDIAGRLGVSSALSERSKIVILEHETRALGVIVDDVDEVLTVEAEQLDEAPGADTTLIEAIAKLGDRLIVVLRAGTILGSVDPALAVA